MSPATTIHRSEVLPPRAMLFLGIVAVHALLAYVVGKSLVPAIVKYMTPDPVEVIRLKERPTIIETPQNPNPTLEDPIYRPPVDEDVAPISYETDVITTTSVLPDNPVRVAGPLVAAEPPPIRLVGRNVIPNSDSYYPAHERRLGREGSAEVQACVSAQGVLSSTPTVQSSSGRTSFDQAAVRLVGDGRFARAMRGEEAVPNCYRFRVSFTLQ